MSTQPIPYPLRMSSDLRSELEAQAKDHGRSMNAEIIARLQKSLEPSSSPSPLTWADLVGMLQEEAESRGAKKVTITLE
jgi:plasmid stability protein